MAKKRRRPSALPKGPILVTAGSALLFGCGPKSKPRPPQAPQIQHEETMPQVRPPQVEEQPDDAPQVAPQAPQPPPQVHPPNPPPPQAPQIATPPQTPIPPPQKKVKTAPEPGLGPPKPKIAPEVYRGDKKSSAPILVEPFDRND